MNHCVPNWDLENETVSSSNLVTMTKGYWDSMQPKRSISLDHEIEELLWEKGPVVNKVIKRPAKVTDNDDAVLPGKPSLTVKDSLMDSVATEITGSSMQEDELAQFLYYPLDDAFDREYCSEFFEGMPSSNMYMHKDSLANPSTTVSSMDRVSTISTHKEFSLPCEGSSTQWTPIFANMMGSSGNGTAAVKASKEPMNSKPAAVDKAMASGTGRISGLPPPPSSDTLPRLWTSQSPLSKCQTNVQNSTPRDTQTDSKKAALQVAGSRAAMPPPKMQAADGPAAKAERTKLVNFSHFSRPAAAIKANLQSIGSVSGLSSTGIMSRLDKLRSDGNSAAEPSIIESNTVEWTAAGSSNGANSKKAQGCYQANRNPSPKKGSEVATTSSEDLADSSAKVSEPVARQNSDAGRSLASATTEKVGEGGDGPEPTITSSSGGSGNSGVRLRKEMNHSGKRKARDVEDSECQSEDVEFESVDRKKQAPSRTTSKRSRAAEVHNLSERRRRDRINEKMRALQELIPHCNKSDKASMLDEAIEYLKTLQLQVQLMSMGGGMGMTPMVLPGGMQHFQVPQVAHLPHLGMGIGMGMGYSMGMLEISASSARPVMPLSSMHVPALPASAIHCPASITMPGMPGTSIPIQRCAGSGLQLSGLPVSNLPLAGLSGPPQPGLVPVSASIPTDLQDQMQSANIMHYQSQQQMQVGPQVMNGNLYNPSMAQQPVQTSAQASGRETEQGNTGNTG